MSATASLPKFLNELVFRSQCWCFVSIAGKRGFSVGSNDAILLYVVLKGSALISSPLNSNATVEVGDMAIVMNRTPHIVRTATSSTVEEFPFLNSAQYVDFPPNFTLGAGTPNTQILCGRLKVRWPGNFRLADLPGIFKIPEAHSLVKVNALLRNSQGKGAAATLTHAASLILISALQQQPEFQALFCDDKSHSPISRAIKLMEERPDYGWTLAKLSHQVGLGRTVFAARFLAEAGKPLYEVLTQLRMNLAQKLLAETQLTIAEIGEKVGYRSGAAFHRRFLQYFNTPPGKFRTDKTHLAL